MPASWSRLDCQAAREGEARELRPTPGFQQPKASSFDETVHARQVLWRGLSCRMLGKCLQHDLHEDKRCNALTDPLLSVQSQAQAADWVQVRGTTAPKLDCDHPQGKAIHRSTCSHEYAESPRKLTGWPLAARLHRATLLTHAFDMAPTLARPAHCTPKKARHNAGGATVDRSTQPTQTASAALHTPGSRDASLDRLGSCPPR